jgi:trehalose/maltose hydrolase-like predicted phosphorylase
VRTALRWTTAEGEATDIVYEVLADRTDQHVGAVHLVLVPHWSGDITITDLLDSAGARRMTPTGGGRTATGIHVDFRTNGTDVMGSLASTLRTQVPARQQPSGLHDLSARNVARFAVRAGQRYEITKYVGVDTSLTASNPQAAAFAAAQGAATIGWRALLARTAAAWRTLWQGDIEISNRPGMQSWVRGALYSLYSNTNSQQDNSISPVGLTSDNYAGQIFWDADVWMFPALLELSPELARPIIEYRFKTLAAARANASRLGYRGAFYPWTSGGHGDIDQCLSWEPPHCVTQIHLQGDVSLAAWQYFLATGDRTYLRDRIWPIMLNLAEFWASRVTRNGDGSYSIDNVAGPDEYSNGVRDGVYTNAVAALALRNASRAAEILGEPIPADWTRIADHLRMPFDRAHDVFAQYDGYSGKMIKQADTVLLLYPLYWPMSPAVASSTLGYYSDRADPDGPAMTDAIESIDSAQIGDPGCETYTYLERAARPFVRGPFGQFMEARGAKAGAEDAAAGTPAFTFTTAAGGFLQAIVNGLLGLRLRVDGVDVDPSLPPQLNDGVKVSGIRWQGRQFTAEIGPEQTTLTLNQGTPLPIRTPTHAYSLRIGSPLTVATRRPDLRPTKNVALCKPVTATSNEPGRYAVAAVDGDDATGWIPNGDEGSLTVDLETPTPISRIIEQWADPSRAISEIEISVDNRTWTPVELDTATGESADHPVARYVRIQVRSRTPGLPPELKELEVLK